MTTTYNPYVAALKRRVKAGVTLQAAFIACLREVFAAHSRYRAETLDRLIEAFEALQGGATR